MLIIDNEIVQNVLTMRECIEVQEAAFEGLTNGKTILRPRVNFYAPCGRDDGYFRGTSVEGISHGVHAVRLKSDIITWPRTADGSWSEHKYCMQPGTYCGLVLLFSTENGEPLAMINDGHLQHMRVGGAAGIGTRLLAREDSHVIGLLGSGGMARTYLEAFVEVRKITKVKVFSRSPTNRVEFAEEMAAKLGIDVVPVDSAVEAVRDVDILSSCTDSMTPTIDPDWIKPGMHVVNLGPFEVSAEAAARFDVCIQQGREEYPIPDSPTFRRDIFDGVGAYVIGTPEQQRVLPPAPKKRFNQWPLYVDVITGEAPGRTNAAQVTHYRPLGNFGVQFSSVGALVYRRAKEAGLGRELPTEWFTQNIRN
jgi:alanine dehydrogenase